MNQCDRIMRRWVYMPFYAGCYLLWLTFGWCVWRFVRMLHLPVCKDYGVVWTAKEEDE